MNISPQKKLRLAFLARMVRKEIHYLQLTDRRSLMFFSLVRRQNGWREGSGTC